MYLILISTLSVATHEHIYLVSKNGSNQLSMCIWVPFPTKAEYGVDYFLTKYPIHQWSLKIKLTYISSGYNIL